jgi:hypothetical protein
MTDEFHVHRFFEGREWANRASCGESRSMPSRTVTARLAAEVATWQADGLLDHATATTLKQRWTQPGFNKLMLVKYLGLVGGLFLACGFLGFIMTVADSEIFAAMLAGGASVGLFKVGLRFSEDATGRYPYSSKVLLALAILSMNIALGLLAETLQLKANEGIEFMVIGLITIPVSTYVAYRYCNVFVLVLAVWQFFHWVGSAAGMAGRSSYVISIQQPLIMAAVAACVVGASLRWVNSTRQGRERFPQVYQAIGLVFLNLSMLILTLHLRDMWVFFMILFTAVGVGQIVLGARLKNGLVLGFGVTSVAVNLFTRYYEAAWGKLDVGAFFLIGGVLLLANAASCEWSLRRRPGSTT